MTAPAITEALALVGREPAEVALLALLQAMELELDAGDEAALLAWESAVYRLEHNTTD